MPIARINLKWVVAIAVLCMGCASHKPAPLPSPALEVSQTHYLGDAISGPQSGTLSADAASNAIIMQARLYAATQIDLSKLAPIGADARLVISSRDGQPVLATNELTSGAMGNFGQGGRSE